MIQAIIENLKARYGWEKAEITDNELYFDFPSGTLSGCDRQGDGWVMKVPPDSVTVVYHFACTFKDPALDGNPPRKPVLLTGDQAHTYHLRGNMLLRGEQAESFLVAHSDKITVSRSPFRIVLHENAKRASASAHRIILFRYLLIKPLS